MTGWKMDDNSNSFAASVPIVGVGSVAPGQSVILIEGTSTTATNFVAAWFGGSPPAGFVIGSYTGSGVGLSTSGDAVNLFNPSGTLITGVQFGAATTGFTFDNTAGARHGHDVERRGGQRRVPVSRRHRDRLAGQDPVAARGGGGSVHRAEPPGRYGVTPCVPLMKFWRAGFDVLLSRTRPMLQK